MASADAAPPWSSPLKRRQRPAGGAHSAAKCRSRSRSASSDSSSASSEVRALDLLELPLEQVELPIARAGAGAQLFQLLAQVAFARVGDRERRAAGRLVGAAEAVEDLQLRGRERQPPVLVLAVERQQRAAELRQVARRGAAPADVRARAAFAAHAPREHELVRVLGQPVTQHRT